ncbi:hypothetical protein ACOZB2_31690, partial [Pantoea endophytica]
MPITNVTQYLTSFFSEKETQSPKNEFLGVIHYIQDAFPGKESPCYLRGALQGEGVISSYNSNKDDNYLYSLNAQTCVIATLYNHNNRTGAVIHFDHNISHLIDEAVNTAICELKKNSEGTITSTLSGGVWFMGGDSIGDPVKNSLVKNHIKPSWDQWSFSPCTEHNYGVVLNLENGKVDIFEHSMGLLEQFQTPLLKDATIYKNDDKPEYKRARDFMTRFKQPAITEKANGPIFTDAT